MGINLFDPVVLEDYPTWVWCNGKEPQMTMNVRSLRLTASFALLGAILAGVLIGWQDLSFDPRLIGALLGAAAGIA